ncbi:MAG: hypothetical protein ABWK00_00960 [Desulfurococcaceae archaeon]
MRRRANIYGIALLSISIATYLVYAAFLNQYRNVLDDTTTWLHYYVATNGIDALARRLLGGWQAASSIEAPLLLDSLIRRLSIEPQLATIAMGVVALVATFLAVLFASGDPLGAGLSSLMLSLTPAFLYWFKYNMYGPYIVVPVGQLLVALIALSAGRNSRALSALLGMALGVCQLFTPLCGLVTASFAALMPLSRSLGMDRGSARTAALLAAAVSLAGLLAGARGICSIDVFAISMLIAAALFSATMGGGIIAEITALVASAAVTSFVASSGTIPLYPEAYGKPFDPLHDLALSGLLAIPSVLYLVRTRTELSPTLKALAIQQAALLSASTLLGWFVSSDGELLTAMSSSVLAALALSSMARGIYGLVATSSFRLAATAVVMLGLAVLGPNIAFAQGAISPPAVYYGGLQPSLFASVPSPGLVEQVAALLRNTSAGGNVLVVANPLLEQWLLGVCGGNVTVALLPQEKNGIGEFVVALSFIGTEGTSAALLSNISRAYGFSDVFVVVGEAVSIETVSRAVYLGAALPLNVVGGIPQTAYYVPMGDVVLLPGYIVRAGFDPKEFLNPSISSSTLPLSLAWRPQMDLTTWAQLFANALKSLGYTNIYPNPVTTESLGGLQPPRFYELVDVFQLPLGQLTTYYASYNITYVMAVYKLVK